MLLDAGDIAHAVRRDAGGGLLHLDLGEALGLDLGGALDLHLGEALGMEVDRATLAALHFHVACIHVREVDGGTAEQFFAQFFFFYYFFFFFAPGLDEGECGVGLAVAQASRAAAADQVRPAINQLPQDEEGLA